jgi:hypothetical protein
MSGCVEEKKNKDGTSVPGHSVSRVDSDNNGIPDAGTYVNGHYTSVYAYDDSGKYYWQFTDGAASKGRS